jgi:outer membrane cobalamin receptor
MGRLGKGAAIREPGYLVPGPSFPRSVARSGKLCRDMPGASARDTPQRSHMSRSHVPALSLVAAIVAALPAHVTAQGAVAGRIADPDGRPVPSAHVFLVSGQAIVASALSGSDGSFLIAPPVAGAYSLRAAAEGLRAEPLAIRVYEEPQNVGTLQLHVSAITDSVVVSAAQVDIPLSVTSSAVTVITGDELRARQHETVADALRFVPGLTVASSGGRGALTAVYPRGGESDFTLVFVDGVQANVFGGGFDFAHLPTTNIERIEVVRGPQSALFGANAIGSVVRIVTRRGGPLAVDGALDGGSFDTMHLTAAASGGRNAWQWSVSGERLTSEGLNGSTAANGQTIRNDQYDRRMAAAALGWESPAGATLRGDVRLAQDERGAPGPFGSDPGATFSGINERAFGTNDRVLAALGAAVPVASRWRAHAQATYGRTDGTFTDFFGNDAFPSDTWSRRSTVRGQLDGHLGRLLDASVGTELLRERAGSTFITANGAETPIARSMAGLFAEGRWSRASRMFVTAGVRVERIARDTLAADPGGFTPRPELPQDTVVSTNPKVAAAWYLRTSGGDFTRLRASAGTGIRPPDGFELAFTDNPSLRPERSRSVDVGLDHALARGRVLVESTAFFNTFDDMIVAVGSFRESSRYQTDNISNARSRGLELAGTTRTTARRTSVQVRLGYTFLATEILAVDGSAGAPPPFAVGDRLLRRPRHQASLDVVAARGPLTAFLRGGGRGMVRDVDPSFGTFGGMHDAAGYVTWDAGASWTFLPAAAIVVRVTNIFDRAYEEALGYPALGRGAFAGLRIAPRR